MSWKVFYLDIFMYKNFYKCDYSKLIWEIALITAPSVSIVGK